MMMFMNRAKTKQNGSMIQEFQFKNKISYPFCLLKRRTKMKKFTWQKQTKM